MDTEKAFNKIKNLFIIKAHNRLGIKGTYLNVIKAKHDKLTANITLNVEEIESFYSKIRY